MSGWTDTEYPANQEISKNIEVTIFLSKDHFSFPKVKNKSRISKSGKISGYPAESISG